MASPPLSFGMTASNRVRLHWSGISLERRTQRNRSIFPRKPNGKRHAMLRFRRDRCRKSAPCSVVGAMAVTLRNRSIVVPGGTARRSKGAAPHRTNANRSSRASPLRPPRRRCSRGSPRSRHASGCDRSPVGIHEVVEPIALRRAELQVTPHDLFGVVTTRLGLLFLAPPRLLLFAQLARLRRSGGSPVLLACDDTGEVLAPIFFARLKQIGESAM